MATVSLTMGTRAPQGPQGEIGPQGLAGESVSMPLEIVADGS
jgi:hypothetical protein